MSCLEIAQLHIDHVEVLNIISNCDEQEDNKEDSTVPAEVEAENDNSKATKDK